MKKLTLNETWRLCLSMWRWIAKQWREGTELTVGQLKRLWLEKHEHEGVYLNCFFCEYRYSRGNCENCPGALVDSAFRCGNSEYEWCKNPIGFYNKLRSLNRKRLAKRK